MTLMVRTLSASHSSDLILTLNKISWGRAADRFGRKPVLVFSLFGVATAVSLFGLSKEIWQMVLFRCLAGMFSGTVV